ncbi:MAG: T9SS type A sorting domain-containing protein [Bacteroidia bacterium]
MKKILRSILLIAALVFLCAGSYAQFSPVWDVSYQHTGTNSFSNESRKVETDASGNVFVLADVTSDIDPNGVITTSTWHYTVILKYSSGGTLMASKNIYVVNHVVSGFDNKGAFGLELDAAGNVYMGYNIYDNGSNYDVSVSKFDNSLNVIWAQKYNPGTIDYGVDMKVDPSGNVYAIAQSISGSNSVYHIIKSNAVSQSLNSIYAFDVNADYLNKLILDASQNVYVTGYRIIAGFKNALTTSVTNAGALRWKVTYNGGSSNRDDVGNNLTLAADGNLYVVGVSDRGAPTINDIMVIKYNPINGKSFWATYHDYNNGNDNGYFIYGPAIDYVYVGAVSANDIILDRIKTATGGGNGRGTYQPDPVESHTALNGATLRGMKISSNMNFYITGSIQATNLSAQSFSASYLAKFVLFPVARNVFKLDFDADAEGDFTKSKFGAGIALDELNDKIIWLRDNAKEYSTHTQEEVLVTYLDVPAQVKFAQNNSAQQVINSPDVIILSNPVKSKIQFQAQQAIQRIEISDITGKIVLSIDKTPPDKTVDVSSLISGIYLCRFIGAESVITKKLVIE